MWVLRAGGTCPTLAAPRPGLVVSPVEHAPSHFPRGALTISGRDPARAVSFSPALFLAPMEGVTEPCFRDLVIDLGGVGGACTEFIRVSNTPVPAKVVRRFLGDVRRDCAVGAQLMASDEEHLAESVAAAEEAGAAFLDLNFGCPAPIVFSKCAGSGLLQHPDRLQRVVRCAVAATSLPVTAKLRVGIDSDAFLEDLLAAACEGGAALITLHARLRIHPYTHPAHWPWLARAKEFLQRRGGPPLVGNGSVDTPEDAARLLRETGCDGVMIGRAAIADPWIFRQALGGPPASPEEAARFAVQYAEAMTRAHYERRALARLKQLARYYRAGNLLTTDTRRAVLHAETLPAALSLFSF